MQQNKFSGKTCQKMKNNESTFKIKKYKNSNPQPHITKDFGDIPMKNSFI